MMLLNNDLSSNRYVNHLYSDDLEGYVQVMQLEGNKVVKLYNTDLKGIVEVVHELEGQEDAYISPNSFYLPKRSNDNIRHYRALYIDLDLDRYSKTEAFYEIYIKVSENKIPKPTMIIDSGRGLHCYWRIEHAPKQASYTWQELQDYLYSKLKPLGADIKATDSARVLRLPNTLNSKNNGLCKVLEMNNTVYSMYDLRKEYLNYVKVEKNTNKPIKNTKVKVKNLFNSYTLHLARAEDMEIISELRDYRVIGYRNSIIHCYCYWKGIYIRDLETLYNVVQDLNSKFIVPLKDTEVKAIVRSTEKAIEKFIEYEQGIRSGEKKRVSKAMRERGGYWYTNKSLIDMLDITEQEQKHLKTIIGTKEKRRRDSLRKYKARRNEQGFTSREQSKADNVKAVKELSRQGLTQIEISKRLKLSQSYISKVINC